MNDEKPITYFRKCEHCNNIARRELGVFNYTSVDLRKIILGGMGKYSTDYCENCNLMTYQQTVAYDWPFKDESL